MRNIVLFILAGALVYVASTGFECASTGVMSAKVYYTQKNYDKARALLEAEVRKNPREEEAWYYLALTAHEQGDHVRVAEACDSAELAGNEFHQKTETVRQSEWVNTWNAGIMAYNNSGASADSLKKAIGLFKAVWLLDPSDPEPLRLIGSAYLSLGDTETALQSYRTYIGINNPNVQKGLDAGLMIGEPESQIRSDFGKPDDEKVLPRSDSVHMLEYRSKGARLFTGANKQTGGIRTLIGWQWRSVAANPDEDRLVRISLEPYDVVGNIFYERGTALMLQPIVGGDSTTYVRGEADLDSAGNYLATAQRLNPADEFATTMLSQIYLRTNQLKKAAASYQELITKFPSNKANRLNYGILLLKQNQYTDAEQQFKGALKIDSNYTQGLYYLAITYKNWSADIQSSIRGSGKKETDADREKYLSKLRLAAESFERLRILSPDEYAPVGQLGEIYAILGEEAKMKSALKSLEGMQAAQRDNPAYWNTLGTIYTVLNDVPKAKDAFDKSDALQKK